MGYDLHITRATIWALNAQHPISAEEWLAYIEEDPELSLSPNDGPHFARWAGESKYPDPWLDWDAGNIYTKNPDEALVEKMVASARALGAQVQGDDGEVYHSGYEPPVYPKPTWRDGLRRWWEAVRPRPPMKEIVPPFAVGDRVVNAFGREATVVEIDPKANHGLGRVKVCYEGGQEAAFALAASGLTPVAKNGSGQSHDA